MSNARRRALPPAKAEGRGGVRFFDTEMDRRKRERRALQRDLQVAIERGEFELHYQPQAEISEKLSLSRRCYLAPSDGGHVSPADFIPIAEESGLIVPKANGFMREACLRSGALEASVADRDQFVTGTVPARELPELVLSVLLETGLSPGRLNLRSRKAC